MNSFFTHSETLNYIFDFLKFIHSKLQEESAYKFGISTLTEQFEGNLDDFENFSDENFELVLSSLIDNLTEISNVLTFIRKECKCDLSDRELKYFQGIVDIETYNLNK